MVRCLAAKNAIDFDATVDTVTSSSSSSSSSSLPSFPLQLYTPQRGFLSLLNLGDGGAVGHKFGVAFRGR
jgi:hypothetical protein